MGIVDCVNKFKNFYKNIDKPSYVDWILSFVLFFFVLTNFFYMDILATVEHSFNLLDSVRHGEFLNFYSVAMNNSTFGHPAVYDVAIYFVFAFWNLPIYILYKVFAIDYMNIFLCRIWMKLMLVLFIWFAKIAIEKICVELGLSKEKSKWGGLLFLTSNMLLTSTVMLAQYDVICVCLMLYGILNYIKNDNRRFLFFFCLANTFKLFSIFAFVPLVLLKEKNILIAIKNLLLGMVGVLVCKILYINNVEYIASTKAFSSDMLSRLQATGFKWNFDGYIIPIFVLLYFIFIIYVYWKKITNEQEASKWSIYIPLVVYSLFVVLVPLNPYWMVLVAPFTVIASLTSSNFKLSILLDTCLGMCLVFISSYFYTWVFGTNIMELMFIDKVIDRTYYTRYDTVASLYANYELGAFLPFVVALACASAIMLIIIHYPQKHVGENSVGIERSVVWLRICFSMIFPMLITFCYFIKADETLYASTEMDAFFYQEDILGEVPITERIVVYEKCELDGIEFEISNITASWIDTSIIQVELSKDGQTIFEDAIPVNTLKSTTVKIQTGKVILDDGEYVLSISGYNSKGNIILLKMTSQDINKTEKNGLQINGDIYLKLYGKIIE